MAHNNKLSSSSLLVLWASLSVFVSNKFANAFQQHTQPISVSTQSTSNAIRRRLHRHNHVGPSSERRSKFYAATDDDDNDDIPLSFRSATSKDIPRCFEIESASYPSDEAATFESLTNRQRNAGDYFLLCTLPCAFDGVEGDGKGEDETIIGFVCATRCHEFTEESMSEHDSKGRLLAVHSVVVDEAYRRKGVATKMMDRYVKHVVEKKQALPEDNDGAVPIESIVGIAKQHLLGFYVRCGFRINRPSPIVHGKELWYDLEMELGAEKKSALTIRTHPRPDESWFCKTEQFKSSLSFPEIKPHLDAHTLWVQSLRESGDVCIVSGYRVDAQGKPGGGGLMFLAAKSYEEARELVLTDPLVANDCVDWELNGWIGQVGGIQVE